MQTNESPLNADQLQFEHVVVDGGATAGTAAGVACAACHAPIPGEYFDVNGHVFCGRCRAALEAAAATPRGATALATAAVYGVGAGIAGAIVYYAVIAIAHLEIGIIAVLIGYMVGYAVRKGARGRGGRRFQILAVALTYGSIALAYTPLALNQPANGRRPAQSSTSSTATSGDGIRGGEADGRAPATSPRGGAVSLLIVGAFIAALPILVIVGSFPSGLISAVIIVIGMRQAWRMTAAPLLLVRGPFRVGAPPSPSP
jgi:hypothetical protein